MNPLRHLLVLLIVPTCMQMPAWAQVQRCTDASGHVTYTDTVCQQGQRSHEVVPPTSAQERAEQEARYQQALERRREQHALDMQRQAQAQAEAAALAAQRPPPPIVVEVAAPAQPPGVVYGPLYPPFGPSFMRPPTMPPQPPSARQHCNVFRCYDGKGNTWSRP